MHAALGRARAATSSTMRLRGGLEQPIDGHCGSEACSSSQQRAAAHSGLRQQFRAPLRPGSSSHFERRADAVQFVVVFSIPGLPRNPRSSETHPSTQSPTFKFKYVRAGSMPRLIHRRLGTHFQVHIKIWLARELNGWLAGWLASWLARCAGWPGWLVGWLAACWMIGWLPRLVG